MRFEQGEYVVYNGTEICRIGEYENKCFDGVTEREYCVLHPMDTKGTYYIPADRLETVARRIMTREQLSEILRSLSEDNSKWISDRNRRKITISEALKTGDYKRILPLMNGLHKEQDNRLKKGKQLISDDKRSYELARRIFHSEVALVFGIKTDEVEGFISDFIGI